MRYFFVSYRYRASENADARVSNCFLEFETMFNVSDMQGRIEKWKSYHVVVFQFFQELSESDYKIASADMPQYVLNYEEKENGK